MSLHRSSGRWQLGLGLALVTTFLWGILPVALSIALQQLDSYTLTWVRFVIAFSLLLPFLALQRSLPDLAKLRPLDWGLLALAVVFLAANYVLFLLGLHQTSASNAEVVIQLSPVLLALGALLIFKERYTGLQWSGLAVFVAGFGLFFQAQLASLLTSSATYIVGSGLVVVGAIVWAIYALAQKQLLKVLPAAATMLLIYAGCALVLLPLTHPAQLLTLDSLHLAVVLFCALNTLVAYGAFAASLEHWEASRVSAVISLAPLVTLAAVWASSQVWPALLKPEPLTPTGFLGAVLVVVGSLAMALGRGTLSPQPPPPMVKGEK
ncbi:DMT family transporter [Gloeobacter kilaueensis]|uniref:Chloramphenical resistance permease RarD n=1 Tax=Gloeobacter kilaueensis (strain ATCC BAA-2537 / CCAP 1431/1 / ULC 316 / JS1) TaxID=1183438 RepID=U5QRI2_GLOK1|nr:DMT family transporter [Gloeobacter kilaueensis]AGY60259.1 chloramphenical resistance permease RarD [Gloeobacter kilaueensis JS1]